MAITITASNRDAKCVCIQCCEESLKLHATPMTLTLTRSSNGTTNGSSISVMSLRTSVLDSRGASSSTDTRHHDNNMSTQHTHPLTHITMATTRQHSILIHWYTSPQQQQINTASESTDTRHHNNNTATSPTKTPWQQHAHSISSTDTCDHGNNISPRQQHQHRIFIHWHSVA